jgi:hypothetical protein
MIERQRTITNRSVDNTSSARLQCISTDGRIGIAARVVEQRVITDSSIVVTSGIEPKGNQSCCAIERSRSPVSEAGLSDPVRGPE